MGLPRTRNQELCLSPGRARLCQCRHLLSWNVCYRESPRKQIFSEGRARPEGVLAEKSPWIISIACADFAQDGELRSQETPSSLLNLRNGGEVRVEENQDSKIFNLICQHLCRINFFYCSQHFFNYLTAFSILFEHFFHKIIKC